MVAKFGVAYSALAGSFIEHLGAQLVTENNIDKLDTIIFTGGEDINPQIYGAKITHSSNLNIDRDKVEMDILLNAINLGKKIFGSCRGHQLINIANGGSLIQDIYFENYKKTHSKFHDLEFSEYVMTLPPSHFKKVVRPFKRLKSLYNNGVNSMHHQGITTIHLGDNLYPVATHKNIVEISMSLNGKIISTQFHPEWMSNKVEFFDFLKEWASE